MRQETIEELRRISIPKQFLKKEYICYEGQPGNEMYIILKGSVGVYVTSAIGTLNRIAIIGEGDFFGEMAIFDNLPRSASCIAIEDTLAVAVTKENLPDFLEKCPELAGQMLEKMSGRIRKLDAELYKNNRFVKNRHVPKFELPYQHHEGKKRRLPYQEKELLVEYKQACPICAKAVSVIDVKRNLLQQSDFSMDCRITYKCCNPLWYEVISCHHCCYTNHYLRFFGINNFEYDVVKEVVRKEQLPVAESGIAKRGPYDILVLQYLQAIHINEHINPGDYALIGGMWRSLYWLAKDGDEPEFAEYCVKKAMEKYKKALEENQILDETGRSSIAMSLAVYMANAKETNDILKYINIATEASDSRIRDNALRLKEKYEK